MDVVYSCYLTLATYFEESGDISFSNHFYKQCLEASVKVRGDGRKKEAEANFNMGVAYEKQGMTCILCFAATLGDFIAVDFNVLNYYTQ